MGKLRWKRSPSVEVFNALLIPKHRGLKEFLVSISEAAKGYFEEITRDPAAAPSNQVMKQHRPVTRFLAEYMDDKPLEKLTKRDAGKFITDVAKIDKHWSRSPVTQKMNVKELIRRGGSGLANRTLNRYLPTITQVHGWASKRGIIHGDNPTAGQSLPKSRSEEVGRNCSIGDG